MGEVEFKPMPEVPPEVFAFLDVLMRDAELACGVNPKRLDKCKTMASTGHLEWYLEIMHIRRR